MQIPILIVGDAPEKSSGLARIGRDLASRLHDTSDKFRVGYLGIGGIGSRYPFQQYACDGWEITNPRTSKAMGDVLPYVWNNFSQGEKGIIFTICEPSWMLWFACPKYTSKVNYELARFLNSGQFKKWGYAIIDAEGPNGKLSTVYHEILAGYDRLVVPSRWAQGLVPKADYLPHGIDTYTFRPLPDKETYRKELGFSKADFVMGTVMTNQFRKDWGLTGAIAAELRKTIPNLKLWWHTDAEERAHGWSIPAIAKDFGIGDTLSLSLGGSDADMARRYNACNITILPSNGEGFGYPIAESEACGVPCVHVDYAAGPEIVSYVVKPIAFRYEGLFNSIRPITTVADWVQAIMKGPDDACENANLNWNALWPEWKAWFEETTSPSSLSSPSPTLAYETST